MDWMPSEAAICQTCHFAIAAWMVCLARIYRLKRWTGFEVVFWFGLVKEFVWDILVEGDTWGSSTVDFVFYIIGAFFMTELLKRVPRT